MALTNRQINEHIGRALRFGFANLVSPQSRDRFEQLFIVLAKVARRYQNNGPGVAANRREAMRKFRRLMWGALTGHDPEDGAAGQHIFEKHRSFDDRRPFEEG